ncbi:MAG: leucine-rich repeat protein [Clostridia bacterium]|nr:leucine-rich repeat protein [Clostridia bacterium]
MGEVKVKRGSSNLKYSYIPNPNSKAGSSVAYEYAFSNPMASTMGVNLKSIDTTGVTVSYAYSDTKLSNITSGTSPFEFQKLNQHVTRYIYIIVTPTSDEIPSTFQANVVWYQGKAGTVTTYDTSGNTISTQEIVKGQPIDEPETPTVEEGYEFGGWYLDEECTIPADFNSIQGVTLYPKIEEPYPEANLPSDWLAWDSTTSSYYVTTGTSTLPTELVIPQTHNDGTNGEYSVNSIGDGAFYSCSGLISITIPANVTEIGIHAFSSCSGLTSIILPSSVTSIGDSAFQLCSGLTSIELSQCTSLTSIEEDLFYGCSGLTSITLPSGITSIKFEGFCGCSELTSITLPSSLTSIGEYAFAYCSGLTSITIPANVTKIRNYAFYNSGLTSMTFEDTSTWYRVSDSTNWENMTGGTSTDVTNATQNATWFTSTNGYYDYYWYKIKLEPNSPSDWIAWNSSTSSYYITAGSSTLPSDLIIPETFDDGTHGTANVTYIDSWAFEYNEDLVSLTLPSTIIEIYDYAFEGCSSLNSINLSACTNLTTIYEGAFTECTSLINIDLSNCVSLTNISPFSGSYVENVILPNNLTTIADEMFRYCTTVKSITLPSTITSIGFVSFAGATSLASINLEDCINLENIPNNTFQDCSSLTSIIIPANVTKIGQYAFQGCSALTSLTFESGGTWYITTDSSYTGGAQQLITENTDYSAKFKTSSNYWYKV